MLQTSVLNRWDVVERLVSSIFVAVGFLTKEDVAEDVSDGCDEHLSWPFDL